MLRVLCTHAEGQSLACSEPCPTLSPGPKRLGYRVFQFLGSRLEDAQVLANRRAFQGPFSFPSASPEICIAHRCSAHVPTCSSAKQVPTDPRLQLLLLLLPSPHRRPGSALSCLMLLPRACHTSKAKFLFPPAFSLEPVRGDGRTSPTMDKP